jgi:hypothetical protein
MDYNSKKLLGHRKLTFSPISENEIQLKGNNKITLKKVH